MSHRAQQTGQARHCFLITIIEDLCKAFDIEPVIIKIQIVQGIVVPETNLAVLKYLSKPKFFQNTYDL